jgi:hypothetical protein
MRARAASPALLLLLAGCTTPDPKAIVRIDGIETHWAVDAQNDTQYIAPVVRFTLTNVSGEPQTSIDVTATFRRKGEEATWGGDFQQVATRKKPLGPGQSEALVLKSDTRYYSNGPVAGMFTHADYKDATVQVFARVGRSQWTQMSERIDVERHVGAKSVQGLVSPPPSGAPPAGPAAAPSATPSATPSPVKR